jgi:hypothetical protein
MNKEMQPDATGFPSANSKNKKTILPYKHHNLVKKCLILILFRLFRIRILKGTNFRCL